MRPHRLEVADVLHAHQQEFLQRWGPVVSRQQRKALRDIGLCRTAVLGAHLQQCDACSYQTVSYLSCRNRHCPKCQSTARDRWLTRQAASLLPVAYSHVVFTLPEQLAPLALRNQRLLYDLLFRAASETLLQIAADPHHLGARIGVLAVLHTWSQNLRHHPHLHCLVPAGGLALDHSRWIACRPGFFLPVRVLSRLFRGKMLAFLLQAYKQGELRCLGTTASLAEPRQFHSLLRRLRSMEWVVYAKPPFGGPEHVLKYLACFSHHIGPAMWKPATWEADTGLARPGLVTDAGGQGSRLGFPSRKASLGIPLPRREAEPRKDIWRILFFSCAAAGPTAGHESAGTPPRRGSPRPARPTPCVP